MKQNLGLIFGGRSGEHEVSLQSAKSIAGAVNRDKYNLYLIAIDKTGNWYMADENNYLNNADDPAKISLNLMGGQKIALVPKDNSNRIVHLASGKELVSLDAVFPIVHGTFGEDGSLQGFMAMLNIPCVGADVLGSSVGMDKVVAKELLIRAEVSVADYMLAETGSKTDEVISQVEAKFVYPVFVKPACSGSSVGVYKAGSRDELKDSIKKALAFDRRVLIEEAIVGREIECAILGNDKLIASVPGEIIPKQAFYSYEAKYIDSLGAQLELPAKLSNEEVTRVQEMAKHSYKALSCSGMARVDMFLTKDGRLILNEINTLPGFTKISMYPKLLALSGIPYPELIDRLVELAISRRAQEEQHLKNVLSAGAY